MNMTQANQARHREPYVGHGEDGARRSAQIDAEEAELLAWTDPRRAQLEESAQRWDEQARALMLLRVGERPSLAQVREAVGNEEWLAALALADLSPGLSAELAGWAYWSPTEGRFTYDADENDANARTFHPQAMVDWEGWAADVDEHGRGWSSTQARLAQLVMALSLGRPTPLVGVLTGLGDVQGDALRILVEWAGSGRWTTRAALGEPRS